MLTLVTGVPGAGKTLNVIGELVQRGQGEWFGRQIYYHNIPGLQIPAWKELTADEVKHWAALPPGGILVVDEAQSLFGQRDAKTPVPEWVHALSTHRHGGFDIYLITQHPMLLDTAARRMVGRHIHFDRRFGGKRVIRYTWQSCSDDPKDYHQRNEAVKDAVVLDKRIFPLYKSAEIHTHKRRYPTKVVLAVLFAVLAPLVLVVGFWQVTKDDGGDLDPEASPASATYSASGDSPGSGGWVSDRLPRVPGLPHTAPIYDDLTKPKSYPRLQCVRREDRGRSCQCYTQQATVVDTPTAICNQIVNQGYFDDTLPDRVEGEGGANHSAPARGAPPPAYITDT